MSKELVNKKLSESSDLEKIMMENDLAALNPKERMQFVNAVCDSVGLNVLTRPFDFIRFNGKTILYPNKGAAEQLRQIYSISCKVTGREIIDGVFIVTVEASNGIKSDSSIGCVAVTGLKGEALANAMMKAETKAKRRVTLSICSLNMLDETEIETIRDAVRYTMNSEGELIANESDLKKVEYQKKGEELGKEAEATAAKPENQNNSIKLAVIIKIKSYGKKLTEMGDTTTFKEFQSKFKIKNLDSIEAFSLESLTEVNDYLALQLKNLEIESELNA